jgi:hypothetical protein
MAGAWWWDGDSMPNMYVRCWRWWRRHRDRAAESAGDGRAQETRICLASEWTDMRCGFDRLAERVRSVGSVSVYDYQLDRYFNYTV